MPAASLGRLLLEGRPEEGTRCDESHRVHGHARDAERPVASRPSQEAGIVQRCSSSLGRRRSGVGRFPKSRRCDVASLLRLCEYSVTTALLGQASHRIAIGARQAVIAEPPSRCQELSLGRPRRGPLPTCTSGATEKRDSAVTRYTSSMPQGTCSSAGAVSSNLRLSILRGARYEGTGPSGDVLSRADFGGIVCFAGCRPRATR